jgi:hypothetical protein
MVTLLSTEKKLKADILCGRLVEAEITFAFAKLGSEFKVSINKHDLKKSFDAVRDIPSLVAAMTLHKN